MNDADRKILTEEVLGEVIKPDKEYHCYGKVRETGETNNCHCFIDGMRYFDTPQDSHDVCNALVKKGKWEEFDKYVWVKWYNNNSQHNRQPEEDTGDFLNRAIPLYIYWLLIESPERTCQLAADFWRMEK